MTKKLIIFVMIILCSANAYAWDASSYANAWGAPATVSTCGNLDNAEAVIGPNKAECFGGKDNNNDDCKVSGNYYMVGLMMMVARDLNENGAYFCPTIITCDRNRWEMGQTSDKKPYWTIYKELSNVSSSDCIWLCKSGYSGVGCQERTNNVCNPTKISRSKWDDESFYMKGNVKDVEDVVAMFAQSEKASCVRYVSGVWPSPMEHDMILAISRWTESGHGVWVSPFVARADFYSTRYSNGPGTAFTYRVGHETLLCMEGYEPNFTNTDCVAIDSDLCEIVQAVNSGTTCQTSKGYRDFGDYDPETMETHFFEDGDKGCWGMLCTTPGYGFDPGASRATCVDCGVSDLRNGIDKYGNCVRCDVGEIFDSATGTCATATALSRDRLYYGPGKDENTAVIEQCWVEPDMYSYSDCVWGNSESTGVRPGSRITLHVQSLGGGSGGNGGGSGGNGGDNDNDSGGTGGGSNGLVVGDVMVPGPSGGNHLQTQSDLKPQITTY